MTQESARIVVLNGFDNPATIVLTHKFGDAIETTTWENVPFGEASNPPLTVHYELGFFSSWDAWNVGVTVADGPNKGTWSNAGFKKCYLTDQDRGALLQFTVAPGALKLNMLSSSCTDDLIKS